MENLEKYTPTEILKIVNDLEKKHELVKNETFLMLEEAEKIEIKINKNIEKIKKIENLYETFLNLNK